MTAESLLRDLLRIDTTNPPGNEGEAADLLRGRLDEGGLETDILTSDGKRPTLVGRVPGPTDRPALVLLSHLDVVGVERDAWTRDPFGGDSADGFLWGRGALDMKGIAVMHAEAACALAASAQAGGREVIVLAVADEETGGSEGAAFVVREHAELVGFGDGRPPPDVLGEGAFGLSGMLPQPILPIVLGEKSAVWIDFEARAQPGHGALPPKEQAPLQLARAIALVSGPRSARVHPVMAEQFRELASAGGAAGAVFRALASPAGVPVARALSSKLKTLAYLLSDTVTPTQIDAGYKHNVVPGTARASFDCRLLPDTDIGDFVAKLSKEVEGLGVTVEVAGAQGGPVSDKSSLYSILRDVTRSHIPDALVVPSLTSGFTDVRFFRTLGATGYGWVPLVVDEELLGTIHGHDERIPLQGLRRAVDAMTEVVTLAST